MRHAQRQDGRVCGAVRVTEVGTEAPIRAVTRNLSRKGMFLVTERRWEPNEVVTFSIAHRFFETKVQAKSVHAQHDGVGFVFLNPEKRASEILGQIIEGLLSDGAWYADRRREARTPISRAIVWRHGDVEVQSTLRDLTTDGAFIETSKAPSLGAKIYVYLPTFEMGADERALPAALGSEASVVRAEEEGFGCKFCNTSDEFRGAVASLLSVADKPGL